MICLVWRLAENKNFCYPSAIQKTVLREVPFLLFHVFSSQLERKDFGGSDFIEIQYCRLPQGSSIREIVSVDAIEHWKNDSLYVSGDDMNAFYQHYGHVFTGGVYNNELSGPMDLLGINFYAHQQAALILNRIQTEMPPDYRILQHWLQEGKQYIGFYILGV